MFGNFTLNPATRTMLIGDALNFVAAILILIIGWIIASAVSRWTEKALQRVSFLDPALKPLARSLVRYAILAVTIIAVLQRFGVETTSLIAVFGAAGLALGLALQGTLSNVAAGVMLLILRPFQIGETIEILGTANTRGRVREIGLFRTVVVTRDNMQLSMPNSTIFSGIVANYSREPLRRVDIHVSIDRFNDVAKAEQVIIDALKNAPRVARQPEPVSGVQSIEEYSVVMLGRFWVSSDDQFRAPYELRRIVQDALQANGISIPVTRQAAATRDGPGEPNVKGEPKPAPSDSHPTAAA
jgi:small conductance mechanosensitive channel